MSDAADTKPDPTITPEAAKPEETPATGEGEKTVTEVAADTAKEAADTVKDAAANTSDTVFSMFGGGPKKEKKEETDEGADEPSGSSKAQKESEVSKFSSEAFRMGYVVEELAFGDQTISKRGVFPPPPPRALCDPVKMAIFFIFSLEIPEEALLRDLYLDE
jgi:hypothetical protein